MKPVTAWSVTVDGALHRCGRYGIAPTFFTDRLAAESYARGLSRGADVQIVRVEIREVAPLPDRAVHRRRDAR
jgi:hypothetical protein